MRIGVKLITGSILALLLGVFLASPLLYTNIVVAPEANAPEPLFSVDVAYAYIERQNTSTVPSPDNINETITRDIPVVCYTIGLNFTRLSEEVDICDAKVEVYRIEVYSNERFIGNLLKYEGLIHNQSIIGQPLRFFPDFDSNPFYEDSISGGGGGATTRWPIGESRVTFSGGGGTTWARTFGEPETIFITVTRLGWVMLTGNSTEAVVLSEPEVVAEVQLEKYRDGFLYNNLISEDQLSQLDDPLYPYGKIFEMS